MPLGSGGERFSDDWREMLPEVLRPTTELTVALPSGRVVSLPVCRPTFAKWTAAFGGFSYGGKPLVDYGGHPVFAELAILRMLVADGWEGVWVETYGGPNYLREMPGAWALRPWSVPLPAEKEDLLKRVWKMGRSYACFDVLAWRDAHILFLEGKQKGRDRLTKQQPKFSEAALNCGVPKECLLVVEWTWEQERDV